MTNSNDEAETIESSYNEEFEKIETDIDVPPNHAVFIHPPKPRGGSDAKSSQPAFDSSSQPTSNLFVQPAPNAFVQPTPNSFMQSTPNLFSYPTSNIFSQPLIVPFPIYPNSQSSLHPFFTKIIIPNSHSSFLKPIPTLENFLKNIDEAENANGKILECLTKFQKEAIRVEKIYKLTEEQFNRM
ncbi:10903_t:CDS:2, partial [Racocetra fulgida]